jgi:ADP-heptose:LPS heptosyltransferase
VKPKLLILELWGLGDLVIATPFIRAAADRYEVTLLAKPFAGEMRPRLWPTIQVVPFTAPWTAFRFHTKYSLWRWPWRKMLRLRRELRASHFDYAVSARWDPRDHLLMRIMGVRQRLGYPRLNSQRYLTTPLARPDPLAHRQEYWRVAGKALGLELPARPKLFTAQRTPPPVALIHTGARLPLRVWPLKNFQELARRLRHKGFTVQMACDEDQLNWWRSQGEDIVCPRSVGELFGCFDRAAVFIGNDSGPGHLAAACGLPTFTFFGPQLHEWFTPLHPSAEAFEGRACPYKPCSDYCRYERPFCLWDVTIEEAWPRVEQFVARNLPAIKADSTTRP